VLPQLRKLRKLQFPMALQLNPVPFAHLVHVQMFPMDIPDILTEKISSSSNPLWVRQLALASFEPYTKPILNLRQDLIADRKRSFAPRDRF
jgi:hypothetical protein